MKILMATMGLDIGGEEGLVPCLANLAKVKKEYDRIQRLVFQQYNCVSRHQGVLALRFKTVSKTCNHRCINKGQIAA